MNNIGLSIITPVFNTGAVMQETIDSVLNQIPFNSTEVPSYELIIVDDHSTDPLTLSMLEQTALTYPDIKVIKNSHNKGVSGARNTGIDVAGGEWLIFLDSDDIIYPQSLSYRWKNILEFTNATWFSAPHDLLVNNKIEVQELQKSSPVMFNALRKSTELKCDVKLIENPIAFFTQYCFISPISTSVKRSAIIKAGGFNEKLKRTEDTELWLKLGLNNQLHYLPEKGGIYRIVPGSLSNSGNSSFWHADIMLKGLIKQDVFAAYRHQLRAMLKLTLTDYCYTFQKQGKKHEQRKWSLTLVRYFPLNLKSWKMLVSALLFS